VPHVQLGELPGRLGHRDPSVDERRCHASKTHEASGRYRPIEVLAITTDLAGTMSAPDHPPEGL
jgi:hypothetical protein